LLRDACSSGTPFMVSGNLVVVRILRLRLDYVVDLLYTIVWLTTLRDVVSKASTTEYPSSRVVSGLSSNDREGKEALDPG
jgi:hypothetical protein